MKLWLASLKCLMSPDKFVSILLQGLPPFLIPLSPAPAQLCQMHMFLASMFSPRDILFLILL